MFDWTLIEQANEARARVAASDQAARAFGSHRDCDHAYDYCALSADNHFTKED